MDLEEFGRQGLGEAAQRRVGLHERYGSPVLVFEHGEHLYAYDRRPQVMRKVEAKNEWRPPPGCYFPHVNSLISWRI